MITNDLIDQLIHEYVVKYGVMPQFVCGSYLNMRDVATLTNFINYNGSGAISTPFGPVIVLLDAESDEIYVK